MNTVYFRKTDTHDDKGFLHTFKVENDFIDGELYINIQMEENFQNLLEYLENIAGEFKVRFLRESITLIGDESSIGTLLQEFLKELYSETVDGESYRLKKWDFSLSSGDGKKSIVFLASGDQQEWIKKHLIKLKKVEM